MQHDNTCIFCGVEIPEGEIACPICKWNILEQEKQDK